MEVIIGYLSTDEREDVIVSLELCADLLAKVASKPELWKWCTLSMHSALQGALVCVLSGTDGTGALNRKSQREWLEWYERSRDDHGLKAPKPGFLAPPLELYEKAKAKKIIDSGLVDSESPLTLIDKDIERLNDFRREFTHFVPKSWAIELAGLPKILTSTTTLINQLISNPAFTLHLDEDQKTRHWKAVETIDRRLGDLNRSYCGEY